MTVQRCTSSARLSSVSVGGAAGSTREDPAALFRECAVAPVVRPANHETGGVDHYRFHRLVVFLTMVISAAFDAAGIFTGVVQ